MTQKRGADDARVVGPVLYAIAALGVLVIVYAAVGWVRAAGREWHETEQSPHDEAAGH